MNTEKKSSGKRKFLNGEGGLRLKFITEFMNRTGHTTPSIAQAMGYKSRQTVFHWLDKDDMKMSKCYELFDACGYRIRFAMVPKTYNKIDCTAEVTMVTEDPVNDDDKRLAFMSRAIAKTDITQEALAQKLGRRRTAIHHWLNEVDDCMISQVYETAEALGMKVTIDIQPKANFKVL
jgi:hypothetical protein